MILQCPSCDARFLVNDALIPLEGRDVRCGRCKHTWFVASNPIPMDGVAPAAAANSPAFASFDEALAHASADEAEEMAGSAARDARLPALHKQTMHWKWSVLPTAGLLVASVLVALFAHYPSWKHAPIASGFYGMMGYSDTKGLALADVNLVKEKMDDYKTRFLVSGNIMNQRDEEVLLPSVRVSLVDKEGNAVWSQTYEVDKTLSAHDIYPFRITNAETTFADKVAQVWVDVGNSYELMVR